MDGSVCAECGRLQPFPETGDHWSVLGLARRLSLDRGDLEARFHELNRRLHPDYHRLGSAEEQAISLANSAAVNTAYRALRDPVRRVEYLLEREGVEAGAVAPGRPPAELFEEIMELQEARQELAASPADEQPALRRRLEAARGELESRHVELDRRLGALFPAWDDADEVAGRALLARMREILATRAYLRTVLRDLDGTLGRTE